MLRKKLAIFLAAVLATAVYAEEDLSYFEDGAKTVRLEETVITTERFETTVRDTPKNITIVTQEDIEKKGAKNIAEALTGVSGLKISTPFGQTNLDLRGQGEANHSNTLILVDGIRQNPVDLGGARINNIDIQNVERIEVIPGGGSVLYGDGAVGGVINIITKTADSIEGYRSIFSEAGNNNLFRYGVNFGEKLTDDLLLQLNYSNSNDGGYRDNGDYDTENIELGIKYILSDADTVSYKYGHYEEEYGFTGALTREQVNEDRKQTTTPSDNADYITDSHTVSYSKKINNNIDFLIDGNFKENDYDSYGSSATSYDNTQYTVKPKLKLSYGEDSHLILGYDYYSGKSEVKKSWGSTVDRDLKKSSDGFFALNTYNWDKFQFVQGVRYEETDYDLKASPDFEPWQTYNENSQYNTAIDFSVNYLYSDTGSTYISYTNGFRTPNTDELALASDDIKEQTHEYFEIGVKDVFFNSFVSASIFTGCVIDEIYFDADNYINTNYDGETEKTGIDLFAEQYLGKLTVNETFTYLDTDTETGKEIPGVSKYSFSFGGNYQLNENLTFSGSANYYGDSYAYSDVENDDDKVNSYVTLDTKAAYDFKNGLEVYAGIDNLFNEKYYDYVVDYGFGSRSYYPAAERTYYVGAKYNF